MTWIAPSVLKSNPASAGQQFVSEILLEFPCQLWTSPQLGPIKTIAVQFIAPKHRSHFDIERLAPHLPLHWASLSASGQPLALSSKWLLSTPPWSLLFLSPSPSLPLRVAFSRLRLRSHAMRQYQLSKSLFSIVRWTNLSLFPGLDCASIAITLSHSL